MVLVFAAMIVYFTILFGTIYRFNRMANQRQTCKLGSAKDA